MSARDASLTSTPLQHTDALELAARAGRPAELEPLGAGRWLLPAAEHYAAAQAAPHTARTYRSRQARVDGGQEPPPQSAHAAALRPPGP